MKRIIQTVASTSALLILAACGGSDIGGKASVTEYNLTDYEGREVSSETLAGTWVAVGNGSSEYRDSDGSTTSSFAIKEYFVVTGSGNSYSKPRCDYSYSYNIGLDGDTITINDFVGTLTDNKKMVGKVEESDVYSNGDTWSRETNLTIVKISDDTSAVAKLAANVDGQNYGANLFCYQQANTVSKRGSLSAKSQEITTPELDLERWVGDEGYTALYASTFSIDWDTDYGDSVSFEVNIDSSLVETVTFNGTNGSSIATGSIVVGLPVQ